MDIIQSFGSGLPSSGPVLLMPEGVVHPMECAQLVEPDVNVAHSGTNVSLVVNIKCVTNRQQTMGVTQLHRRMVFLDFVIDAPSVTVIDGMIRWDNHAIIIENMPTPSCSHTGR